MNSYPIISSLHIYPVKSCGGIQVDSFYAGKRGPEYKDIRDRSWMLVDRNGKLVSQRDMPRLAQVKVEIIDYPLGRSSLRLTAPWMGPLILNESHVTEERMEVAIHKSVAPAHVAVAKASAWFNEFLLDRENPVRLVSQSEDDQRFANPAFADPGDEVGFADGYAYLIANEATLAKLNAQLAEPVPMNRFRPNIVIAGALPEAEYGWKRIAAGLAAFKLPKPCDRCVVTTLDQVKGERTGTEPLAALVRTSFLNAGEGERKIRGPIFGENAQIAKAGRIAVGDPITVLETKPAYAFTLPKMRAAAPAQPGG